MASQDIYCLRNPMRPVPRVLHTHGSHELFFCATGRGHQHTDWGDTPMKAGDLFLFPAGRPHIGSGLAGTDCVGWVVALRGRTFDGPSESDRDARAVLDVLTARVSPESGAIPLSRPGSRRARAILDDAMDEHHAKRPGYRCAVKAAITRLLMLLLRDPEAGQLLHGALDAVRPRERLADVLEYLHRNFMQPLTVASVARLAHLSRSHFHAVFKEQTGSTLTDYLNHLRIDNACRQLLETDQPIVQIGLQCGFNCHSHFYSTFRRITGKTPRQVRACGEPVKEDA